MKTKIWRVHPKFDDIVKKIFPDATNTRRTLRIAEELEKALYVKKK